MEQKTQNLTISGQGLKAKLIAYLEAGNVDEARKLFACHKERAKLAIAEYRPELHAINVRLDKVRNGKNPYETNKLPRALQRVINETNTFFMFGNPINFTIGNPTEEVKELTPYFNLFKDFIEDHYFNERMREAKRIAGSETEAAKFYSYYTDEDDPDTLKVRIHVLANSKEQTLWTLFNKFGDMVAFAYGYCMRTLDNNIEEHWDVMTSDKFYYCTKHNSDAGWEIEDKDNEIGKIPVIYYQQETEWNGSQKRIERDEWVDSKRADIVEYFGDPYLLVTRDVVGNRFADAEEVGKVIALDGEQSRFEFVAPPDSSDMVTEEKKTLKSTIQQDTFSPDWTYESIMGLGTLSGEAMRRINLPGYVKRSTRAEIYNELIKREIHLIIALLCNVVYVGKPEVVAGLRRLRINFAYQDPLVGGIEDNSTEIATLVGAGVMSIRSGIEMNRNVADKDAEEERIWAELERKMILQAKIKAATQTTNQQPEEGKEE